MVPTTMRRGRTLLIFAGFAAAFAWGAAMGAYQVFPYELIRQAKNRIDGDDGGARSFFTNPDAFAAADADLILDTRADVVMLGDSVTAGGRWQELFPGADIVNRGVGGDTLTGIVRRAPRIAGMRPRQVFVMIGINDIVSGNLPEEVLPLYDRAVQLLRSGGAQVFVQPSLACGARCTDAQRERQRRINAALPGIAARHGAVWIDLNRTMAAGGRLRPDYTWDGIHLTGAGYAAWREALQPFVAPRQASEAS